MEVLTILVGVVAFVLSAIIIYCISVFSMREKTFEEVMEEQRRRQEEEREKAKAEKKAEKEQKRKYKKGKPEKVKEKSAQVTEPELKDQKMVNIEIDPEIIEPTESLGLSTALRQRGKKEKVAKPILHNKGEVSLISEKTVEVQHKPIVPKDELELKKKHDSKVVENIEKVKIVPTEAIVTASRQEIKENLPPKKVEKEELKLLKQSTDDVEKRAAKPKPATDDFVLNGSKLISSVKTAKLSDSEVQTLIDILLNRQGVTPIKPAVSETWNKKSQKGDPVSQLKKQLEEKEKALLDEQGVSQSSNAKIKELQKELLSEKTKYAALDKTLQEKNNQHKSEIEAFQLRMQHSHEQSLSKINTLEAKVRQLSEQGNAGGDKNTAVKPSEDNKLVQENKILQETLSQKVKEASSLTDKINQLEKELSNTTKSVQLSESNKKSYELKISQYEEQIKKLEAFQKDTDSVINKKVDEIASELKKSEAKNSSLSSDLQKANSALSVAEVECSSLKTKLEELELHLRKAEASKEVESKLQESEQKRSDLEGNIKNLDKQLADLSRRLNESNAEVNQLQSENKRLSDEIRLVNERLQSAPASNGDIHDNGPSIPSTEHERILADKNKEISELTAGLETQKKAVTSLNTQLDNKTAEVTDLQQQLSQQKSKNNELREKNWKAMEALELAEKNSAEKVDKALKSARELSSAGITELETSDKAVFLRLFPEVQISDKLSHKEWVVAFEKQAFKKLQNTTDASKVSVLEKENVQLKNEITGLKNTLSEMTSKAESLQKLEAEIANLKSSQSSSLQADSEKYLQLENENLRLKSEVENYRSIVSETENKLHQLEKTIDAEQKKWQEELTQAKSAAKQDTRSLEQVKVLDAVVSQQAGQIEEYRKVLAASASRLVELEEKVSSEEKSWQDKYSSLQSQLHQTKDQLSRLKPQTEEQGSQEDLSDLCFAYHCVEKSLTNIVDELQLRIVSLESELQEAKEKLVVITKEKETVITRVSESHTSSSEVELLQKQINELQSHLDSERKKTKELSLNVVKLNGIIKTGQDALAQEQGIVKKLQESLDSKSVSSGLSEAEEIEQLRTKLSEKQKLLEREMATNKQLSERLAQLGMLGTRK
ncbi:ribosome-binding protein 1-like isoform X3 [Biomphalaria glabrata]|uniref:Ribosome-binding protein 1-like isoform X3 n=1 Tax=Biomphalaria glabrata TaxID=6526 RepID=A0A9W2ZVT7_BIOGL|nr:ribosome-binding protein 1-like isoform X3 [Biomphalaria glabrata]